MNVLIVEDNKPVSLLLSRITEEAGLGYVIAANGEAALRLFGQRDIAMAIIDVELPGLDGYQVARDIRNQAPALPIIIISANAGDAWRQQAFDAGADDFLTKPLRPSELAVLFRRHLNLSPAP
jgi:two-component system, cell cycle response regulator DivK